MTEQFSRSLPPSFDWNYRRNEEGTDINILALSNCIRPIVLAVHDGEKESAVSMSIENARKLAKKLDEKIKQAESEYSPHRWNKYPDVKPPVGVPMMLEVVKHTYEPCLEGLKACAKWTPVKQTIIEDDGVTQTEINEPRWRNVDDGLIEEYGVEPGKKEFVAYFRPWPELEV